MAVQKSKKSKMKTNSRFSANSKLATPNLVECPQCHELKSAHRVCPKCGYYNGKQVVDTSAKEKKD